MPGLMYRPRVIVSGVAGAPYYLTGYFDADGGEPQAAADAWFTFVTRDAEDAPAGSVWALESAMPTINASTGDTTAVNTVTPPTAMTGTNGNQLLPTQIQLLVRWHTGIYLTGREVRGRFNHPAHFTNELAAGGTVNAGLVTYFNTKAAALVSDPDSVFGVWSRKNGTFEPATGGSVWNLWADLRSRRS